MPTVVELLADAFDGVSFHSQVPSDRVFLFHLSGDDGNKRAQIINALAALLEAPEDSEIVVSADTQEQISRAFSFALSGIRKDSFLRSTIMVREHARELMFLPSAQKLRFVHPLFVRQADAGLITR